MNAFRIARPPDLVQAAALLQKKESAAVYAGGTELILVLKHGFLQYDWLVDIKAIPELKAISVDRKRRRIRIGGAVTHRELALHPEVRQTIPELAEMEERIANPRVRSTGTIGGNLCFAEPHSDLATFSLLLEGHISLVSAEGRRTLPLAEFIVGPYETALQPGEILEHLELDLPEPDSYIGYDRLSIHERPTATAGVRILTDGSTVTGARVIVGCVGPIPQRLTEVEAVLIGLDWEGLGDRALAAAHRAAETTVGLPDLTGSEEYKQHLAGALVRRACEIAGVKWRKRHGK